MWHTKSSTSVLVSSWKYDAMFRAYKCVIKQTKRWLNFITLCLYSITFQVRIIVFYSFKYNKGHLLVFCTLVTHCSELPVFH